MLLEAVKFYHGLRRQGSATVERECVRKDGLQELKSYDCRRGNYTGATPSHGIAHRA